MMPAFSVSIFVVTGVLLGNGALSLLTPQVLSAIEPAVAAALVVIGILLGVESRVGAKGAAVVMLGVAIASHSRPSELPIAVTIGIFAFAVVAISAAAWLLVGATQDAGEQDVFALGAVLLLGGASAYLSFSAILTGFIAGTTWRLAGGSNLANLQRGVSHLQHPLIVTLLVAAGAQFRLPQGSVELAAVGLALGPLAYLWSGRESKQTIPRTVLGIAAALDVNQAWPAFPEASALVLAAAVFLSFGWDAAAWLKPSPEPAEA
jgi:hypothetical protein